MQEKTTNTGISGSSVRRFRVFINTCISNSPQIVILRQSTLIIFATCGCRRLRKRQAFASTLTANANNHIVNGSNEMQIFTFPETRPVEHTENTSYRWRAAQELSQI